MGLITHLHTSHNQSTWGITCYMLEILTLCYSELLSLATHCSNMLKKNHLFIRTHACSNWKIVFFLQCLSSKLFLSSLTELHPLSDFLSFLLSSSHPLSLIFYALSLSRFCYGHGWSLSLFPNVTSLTVVANGSPFSHCGFGGSLLYGSWFVVRFSWVFVVICFWLSFGNGGGCCDLILAGFQPLW